VLKAPLNPNQPINQPSVCVRVSYIFCDPVLACISVIPVLLLHRLPIIVEDFMCLDPRHASIDNNTLQCDNRTSSLTMSHAQRQNLTVQQRLTLQDGIVSSVLDWPFWHEMHCVHAVHTMSYYSSSRTRHLPVFCQELKTVVFRSSFCDAIWQWTVLYLHARRSMLLCHHVNTVLWSCSSNVIMPP